MFIGLHQVNMMVRLEPSDRADSLALDGAAWAHQKEVAVLGSHLALGLWGGMSAIRAAVTRRG
jgi:hypothetical protein